MKLRCVSCCAMVGAALVLGAARCEKRPQDETATPPQAIEQKTKAAGADAAAASLSAEKPQRRGNLRVESPPPFGKTIEAAVAYFVAKGPATDPAIVPVLIHLKNKFGLREFGPIIESAERSAGNNTSPGVMVFRRLLHPDTRVTPAQIAGLEYPVDKLTGPALHCDYLGVSDEYLRSLQDATMEGRYPLTHAVLATQWLMELGCATGEKLAQLREMQLAAMQAALSPTREKSGDPADDRILMQATVGSDLAYELVAMMYYAGYGKSVDPAAAQAIMDNQLPDGGWRLNFRRTESHDHATALALWALLEIAHPERSGIPMLDF